MTSNKNNVSYYLSMPEFQLISVFKREPSWRMMCPTLAHQSLIYHPCRTSCAQGRCPWDHSYPWTRGNPIISLKKVIIMVAYALAPCVARTSAPWYWLCRIGKFVSHMEKDSNYLCHVSVEERLTLWIYFYSSCEKLSTQMVNGKLEGTFVKWYGRFMIFVVDICHM